jgi:hypothetical protein
MSPITDEQKTGSNIPMTNKKARKGHFAQTEQAQERAAQWQQKTEKFQAENAERQAQERAAQAAVASFGGKKQAAAQGSNGEGVTGGRTNAASTGTAGANSQQITAEHSAQIAQQREALSQRADQIRRTYAAQDAERARNARMYSQEVGAEYKESAERARERVARKEALEAQRREQEAIRAAQRAQHREMEAARARTEANTHEREFRATTPRKRAVSPLTSQESYDRTRNSMEHYEQARAMRDALSPQRMSRTTNREVIDGRGSVDSRAFNELNELVGYSIDERDKTSNTSIYDSNQSREHWQSHRGDGSGRKRRTKVGNGVPSTNLSPTRGITQAGSSIPPFVKIAVPVIVILIIILLFILFH